MKGEGRDMGFGDGGIVSNNSFALNHTLWGRNGYVNLDFTSLMKNIREAAGKDRPCLAHEKRSRGCGQRSPLIL